MNLVCPKCGNKRVATRVNQKGEIVLQCWRCGEMQSSKEIKEIIARWQKREVAKND
jgi:uncharacterized Zn finger protein